MKTIYKTSLLASLTLIFITACGSASSDAKKVEIKKVSAPAVEATATTQPAVKKVESQFEEGKHYVEIFPEMQTDSEPGKVEVVELMWLGCPHCYSLEPQILKYKENHPKYVEFKQVPAMLNPSWSADANTFFIAELLDPKGEKELIHRAFQAIHDQKRRLRNPDAVTRFFVQQGFTEEQVNNVRNSMAFQAKLKRAQEISSTSQAQSVPTIIINGKYRTSPYMAGGNDKVMEVLRFLAKQENK
ncbi:thiol:disulfide interchange protein DsbA/DsbL [Cocleimonas sp. KMM 6892]|uniref:thiol:disulfide interchange protein DsbA/DsbL n=1 Tax=unclassified Cocleimonas TaxID=2639732 RepID=UPI002DB6DE76|nr:MULTISPECIES: thiol:disulfide interchange protein DsbA/DsbL [unclassified Cocleimonas]MEB8432387.1 thiol:disulfide interchange protein DsbA/DsbL [Cocleimonas sp. KMM 6892]MEC4715246.1 thiol:disulfide interchange protein DsbA/DsbL [Cocleimonas sp. KMM 6895]MEC4745135.1 thiol:disulfide interchange protein DsbA/DsbL [Cocleimonas sp. KMM 6896]